MKSLLGFTSFLRKGRGFCYGIFCLQFKTEWAALLKIDQASVVAGCCYEVY
jgi:hypothetical protein